MYRNSATNCSHLMSPAWTTIRAVETAKAARYSARCNRNVVGVSNGFLASTALSSTCAVGDGAGDQVHAGQEVDTREHADEHPGHGLLDDPFRDRVEDSL